MRKTCLFLSLLLINISPLFFLFGLFNNFKSWEWSTFSSLYLWTFSISYFAEQTSTIIFAILILVFLNSIVNFSVIFSYFKTYKFYVLSVCLCFSDLIISILMRFLFASILDVILIVLILLSKKQSKIKSIDKNFSP